MSDAPKDGTPIIADFGMPWSNDGGVVDDPGGEKMSEKDPHGIYQHQPGAKLDAGKVMAGVLCDFSLALMAVAEVGTFGAVKYTRGGWQSVPNGVMRYTDAMWRHLLKERHEPVDSDSGLLHASHAAWGALARLELMLREEAIRMRSYIDRRRNLD